MDVDQATHIRHRGEEAAQEMPDRSLIEKVVEAAQWAPNHQRTQPWKYIVLTGKARYRLGEVLAATQAEGMTEEERRNASSELERVRQKPLRAPVIIAAVVRPSMDPKVEKIEAICTVAAGMQNALLTAHALGLGAIWRPSRATPSDQMKRFLGLTEEETLLGFLYIGHPSNLPKERPHMPVADQVIWLEN